MSSSYMFVTYMNWFFFGKKVKKAKIVTFSWKFNKKLLLLDIYLILSIIFPKYKRKSQDFA